ncbi:hypothetical protein CFC21_075222 [Triticum aestivum]|uniref:DUF4220 domain-containing protein n=3 Tax=Triticum TaxID=4564 RepID=A0A9R1AUH4_TRITD|nr:uncharacterized protein LOC123117877 [Triticum aestivum]KAF7069613.1 hypothetical protein CFC21_075222 [Triticum aestivum]VAI40686.1 unnamed protein product [Triticum turgidum subsp. durum]
MLGFLHLNTSNDILHSCAAHDYTDFKNTIFYNLTDSYIAQFNHTTTLLTSIIMFVLAALFFNLNLFSRLSDVSAILDPRVRLFITSALSLFLPVMSYLFSEARNATGGARSKFTDELPLRARLILIWMLLVELLRKKAEEIHMQGYSGTMDRVGRVLLLGSFVFFHLHDAGKRSMVGILWLLCATRLVQRIVFTEVGKRSLAYGVGKNARLITSYMAQVLEEDEMEHRHHSLDGDELLKGCKYAVMEEENLVVEASPGGYRLTGDAAPATVGKIWGLPEICSLDRDKRLRQLCLSFALFKLLRRRFERLPATTAAEARSYREVIFKAMRSDIEKETSDSGASTSTSTSTAEALFRLTKDELSFLSEYYHPIIPVVLASPFFLLANYLLLPLLVFVLCLVLIVLCTNGDVGYAVDSIKGDNYFTFFSITTMMTGCLPKIFTSRLVFFSFFDFSITSLLFLMVVYEEVWEFLVLVLSDWFMVSLLCKYAVKPDGRLGRVFLWAIRGIMGMRSIMHRPHISFNQLCVVRFCWLAIPFSFSLPVTLPIIPLPSMHVPDQVKLSIMEYLSNKLHDLHGNPTSLTLSRGRLALADDADLLPFCDSDSVAEVILTWHIATSLFEVRHSTTSDDHAQAQSMSKYCAYLVAIHPELLPEYQESTELVFKDTMLELSGVLGFWRCYFLTCVNTRYSKIMGAAKKPSSSPRDVVKRGAELAHKLVDKAENAQDSGDEAVWKLLANLWVELVVYVAPSNDDGCIMGHEKLLVKGGEFITMLWALASHAGISRPADTPAGAAVAIERVTDAIV